MVLICWTDLSAMILRDYLNGVVSLAITNISTWLAGAFTPWQIGCVIREPSSGSGQWDRC